MWKNRSAERETKSVIRDYLNGMNKSKQQAHLEPPHFVARNIIG